MAKSNRPEQLASGLRLTKADLQSSRPSGAEAEELPLPAYGERGLVLPELLPSVTQQESGGVGLREVGERRPESVAEVRIGAEDRQKIVDTTQSPYRAICHLLMQFRDGKYLGTGTFIGPRTILTAGHNLFNPKTGDTASSIVVTRGKNGSSNPVAEPLTAVRSNFFWASGWNRGVKLADFGAIVFDRDVSPDFIGFRSFSPSEEQELRGITVAIAGYPGRDDHPRPGDYDTMWGHASRILRFTADQLFYDIDTTPGQSGSSVIFSPSAGKYYSVGIHNYGDEARNENFATRISDPVFDLIASWK